MKKHHRTVKLETLYWLAQFGLTVPTEILRLLTSCECEANHTENRTVMAQSGFEALGKCCYTRKHRPDPSSSCVLSFAHTVPVICNSSSWPHH